MTPLLLATFLASTFNRDVAPILLHHCVPCHRSGAAAPFPLISYADAQSRAGKITNAIASRTMPPWMPEPGHAEFKGERRLSDEEIQRIRDWVAAGTPEGVPEELPPLPALASEWAFGAPDLVVELPEPYELSPSGADVYRNFVVPIPPGTNRFVRAFDFRPENPAVHHARVLFDATGEARRRDDDDPICGFGGTMPPGKFPAGQLLGWVPGKRPTVSSPGLAWPLDGLGDMVVQLHLRKTGKREIVRPRVALYLTNRPPDKTPALIGLVAQTMDIPAGASNYTVVRSAELPVDAELLSVMPHAHFLARVVEFSVTPPGGAPRILLRIPNWNFDWQDEYHYAAPVALRKGTLLEMRMIYDNSAANPKNPRSPPRRVMHGPESTDEMAELWLQLLPKDTTGFTALRQLGRELGLREDVADFSERIKRDPENARYRLELGKALGALGRRPESFEQLAEAVRLNPDIAEAHHYVGLLYFDRQMWGDARLAFEQALRLDPNWQRSYFTLGLVAMAEGNLDEAEKLFLRALELNPADEGSRQRLEDVKRFKAEERR